VSFCPELVERAVRTLRAAGVSLAALSSHLLLISHWPLISLRLLITHWRLLPHWLLVSRWLLITHWPARPTLHPPSAPPLCPSLCTYPSAPPPPAPPPLVCLISLVSLRAGIGGKTTKASNMQPTGHANRQWVSFATPLPRYWPPKLTCVLQITDGRSTVNSYYSITAPHTTAPQYLIPQHHSTTAPHTTASQHLIPQHLIPQHHSTTAPHTAAPQHLIPQHSTPTWLSLRRRGGMRKAAAVAVVAAVAVAAGAGVGVGVGAGAGAGAGVGVGAVAHLHENRHGDTIAVQLHRA
jgi:hypothetical protein